jgi:hypothetical protein
MSSELEQLDAAIAGSAVISKSDYLGWASSPDLPIRARAFHLSAYAWARISPEPSMDEQCEVMGDYLLACISTNPAPDNFIHSGFEAGHALASWLKHLSGIPSADGVIQRVAKNLERLYRDADAQGRNRIATGALEHILEAPRLRSYFAHWEQDAQLREAYEPALSWGRAHSDEGV